MALLSNQSLYLLLIMCLSTFGSSASVSGKSLLVNKVPQASFQNGAVTILNEESDDSENSRKCGKHCQDDENDDEHGYQDGDGDDDDDDDDFDENDVEFVDQRQNGTENYRIRVNGVLLIITPPEVPMPMPTTSTSEAPPLAPPTAPSNSSNSNDSTEWNTNGTKTRFNVRRHGQHIGDQQKRKLSRYQARIPQFIKALLRNRFAQHAQHNQ